MDIKQYIASGIIESYIMGLCTPGEEKKLEQLRLQYPELDNAIILYEEQMKRNMMKHFPLPDEEVDKRILGSFDTMDKPPAPVISLQTKKQERWKFIAAAAILLLLLSLGFNYYLYKQSKKQVVVNNIATTLPLRDYEIMIDSTITPVAMYGVVPHAICRCTMFWDKKTGKIYIMIHHLPESNASKDYQLWAMVEGRPISIGLIRDEIRGRFIEMINVPAAATSFIVTLENAGGSTLPDKSETYLQGAI